MQTNESVAARKKLRQALYIGVLMVGVAVCIAVAVFSGPNPKVSRIEPRPTIEPLTLVFAKQLEARPQRPPFVGPESCSSCHRAIYDGFKQTRHPGTCREVVEAEMPPGFDSKNGLFQSPHANVRFEMSRQGKDFYQTSFYKNPNGVDQRAQARIDLVLGAGGVADDVFLTWRNDGTMQELPMVWLYPSKCWSTSHFDPNSNGDFSRALTVRCFECHNTWAEHVPGSLNQYRREGKLLGVTCESCHGPAGKHVDFHQKNPEAKGNVEIIKPTRLERERQIEVCTQCHSNAMKHLGAAFQFRPGDNLSEHYKTIATTATEEDRVANQITYLRQSKCFQNSQMTCVTCHNPHQPNTAKNSGSSSCAKCHKASDCSDAANIPEPIRADCVSCHMPSYLKINVNFETESDNYVPPLRRIDHRIASHPHARDETLLKFHLQNTDEVSQSEVKGLRQSLVDHYLKEAEACRKTYRFLGVVAALREVVRFEDSIQNRKKLKEAVEFQTNLDLMSTKAQKQLLENNVPAAMTSMQNILNLKPNDAKTHGRIGTEYAKLGQMPKAVEHLKAVSKHDPNDVFGVSMLGWLAYLGGRDEEAIEYYSQAEAIEPREAKLKYHMGLVLARLKRLPEARNKFKEALEIEPDRPDALQAFIFVAIESGQPKEALPYAERIVKMTGSQDVHALMMLADVYQSADMIPHAIQANEIAMKLAPSQDPAAAAKILTSLRSLRGK